MPVLQYFLFQIEKTLQKDELSDCFEPYSKDTDNQKVQTKLHTVVYSVYCIVYSVHTV